jgi:hypothetical protein
VVGLEVEMVGEMAAGKEVQTLVEMVVEGEYCHRRPFFVLVAKTLLLSSFLDFFLSLSIKQTLVIVDLPYIRVTARVFNSLIIHRSIDGIIEFLADDLSAVSEERNTEETHSFDED